MREVKQLLPTESLLLLDIRGATGKQLITKTIEELIFLGVIKIETHEFGDQAVRIIKEKDFENSSIQDYHKLFIYSIREHYNAYQEITKQNALTPNKLIGSVRYKLDFNDNKYKFKYIYHRLELWGLAKSKFPFYFFNRSLTKNGEHLRLELRGLIENLREIILKRKKTDNFEKLKDKIGVNIILVPGIFRQPGQTTDHESRYFVEPDFAPILLWDILDSVELEQPELEFPDLTDCD